MKTFVPILTLALLISFTGIALTKDITPVMVEIPSGSFLMGSEKSDEYERPVHEVSIKTFYLSEHEVTKGQFKRFIEQSDYITDAEQNRGNREGCYTHHSKQHFDWVEGTSWKNHGFPQDLNEPVVCISWHDTQAFINWLNQKTGKSYRLPTEAEWEYAARAGTQSEYYFGDDINLLCKHANFADSSTQKLLPWATTICSDGHPRGAKVGQFPANPFGLFDMLGNAWEWTQDCWYHNYQRAPSDGSARSTRDCEQRVLRGGSAGSPAEMLRVANRDKNKGHYRFVDVGFRLAHDKE